MRTQKVQVSLVFIYTVNSGFVFSTVFIVYADSEGSDQTAQSDQGSRCPHSPEVSFSHRVFGNTSCVASRRLKLFILKPNYFFIKSKSSKESVTVIFLLLAYKIKLKYWSKVH